MHALVLVGVGLATACEDESDYKVSESVISRMTLNKPMFRSGVVCWGWEDVMRMHYKRDNFVNNFIRSNARLCCI